METTEKAARIARLIASFERMRRAHKNIRSNKSHEGPIFPLMELSGACGNEALSLSKVAEIFGVTPAAATQFINRLNAHGYITREENPDDRRQVKVRLSDLGEAKVKQAQEEFYAMMGGLLDYLGEEESDALNAIIEKVAEYFNQEKGENHEKENEK